MARAAPHLARIRAGGGSGIDRVAWAILGLACASSAAVLLYLNRGTTFFLDELVWFADVSSYAGPSSVLEPHNSHLHGTTRAVYYVVLETVGTNYLVMRLLGVMTVLVCAVLFFVLAKRRIGSSFALGIAVLLLFYGSAWQHVLGPIGFTVIGSIAAGLGALLMLERDDRLGDISACALICLSVFTFTTGLGFLVGSAVSVLLRPDRVRRSWIFLIPLGLYGAWWIWALQFDQGRVTGANIDAIPEFFASSLAVVGGALTGVNVPFSRFDDAPLATVTSAPASPLGWIVGCLFVGFVLWRIVRRGAHPSLYVSLAVLSTYWLAAALAQPVFFETQSAAVRYVYPGSIGLLLVATDAVRGIKLGRGAVMAVAAVGAFSLMVNLVFLMDGSRFLRNQYSAITKANLAAYELGATSQPPLSQVTSQAGASDPIIPYGPALSEYLASVEQYGSPAYTLEQLREKPAVIRLQADLTLADLYGLTATPTQRPMDLRNCSTVNEAQTLKLAPGTIYLRGRRADAEAAVSRFAPELATDALSVSAAGWSRLAIPSDGAPERWKLRPAADGALRACYSGRPG